MALARRISLFCALLIVGCASAVGAGADPAGDRGSNTFERRAWTAIEGAPTNALALAQDADGLLWFASPGGLYRYDGEKFAKIDSLYGHPLRSANVINVIPLKRGIAVLYQCWQASAATAR